MTTWRCVACGSVYSDKTNDDGEYYHACPVGTVNRRDENKIPLKGKMRFEVREGVTHELQDTAVKSEGRGRIKVKD